MTQATLNRTGADVKVYSHPIARTYTVIDQCINGEIDSIVINHNEIDNLINVLRDYQKRLGCDQS